MEEKKFLGMPKKVCLGLGWLTLVIAIVGLAVDYEKMSKEDKRQFVSVFVGYGFLAIFVTIVTIISAITGAIIGGEAYAKIGWIFTLINFLGWAVMLVCMIFAFTNEDFQAPVFYNIATNFVKDENEASTVDAEVVEEKEEPKEEKKEEAPKEE